MRHELDFIDYPILKWVMWALETFGEARNPELMPCYPKSGPIPTLTNS